MKIHARAPLYEITLCGKYLTESPSNVFEVAPASALAAARYIGRTRDACQTCRRVIEKMARGKK